MHWPTSRARTLNNNLRFEGWGFGHMHNALNSSGVRIVEDVGSHSVVVESPNSDGSWTPTQILTARSGLEVIGMVFATAFITDTTLDSQGIESWAVNKTRRAQMADWTWAFTRLGEMCSVTIERGDGERVSHVATTFLEALGWAMRRIADDLVA